VAWQLRRDGTQLAEVTEPRASDQPAGPGSYSYTVTAVGVDGQHSAESEPSIVVVPNPPVPPAVVDESAQTSSKLARIVTESPPCARALSAIAGLLLVLAGASFGWAGGALPGSSGTQIADLAVAA